MTTTPAKKPPAKRPAKKAVAAPAEPQGDPPETEELAIPERIVLGATVQIRHGKASAVSFNSETYKPRGFPLEVRNGDRLRVAMTRNGHLRVHRNADAPNGESATYSLPGLEDAVT